MVRYAPINVPLYRRIQTASVLLWMLMLPIALVLLIYSVRMWFYPTLAYLVFILLDSAPESGGRRLKWVRKLALWRHMRDYFPMSLIKTKYLDCSKSYIFGYHPSSFLI
jgi:2-acylglycerol O-acyltransferase 2